jgi:hypothetical protein
VLAVYQGTVVIEDDQSEAVVHAIAGKGGNRARHRGALLVRAPDKA